MIVGVRFMAVSHNTRRVSYPGAQINRLCAPSAFVCPENSAGKTSQRSRFKAASHWMVASYTIIMGAASGLVSSALHCSGTRRNFAALLHTGCAMGPIPVQNPRISLCLRRNDRGYGVTKSAA